MRWLALACVIGLACLAYGDETNKEVQKVLELPAQERVSTLTALAEGIEASGGAEHRVDAIRLLAGDALYEVHKQEHAYSLFKLARSRFNDAPTRIGFARYVAIYDALSIAEAVRADWLTGQQRKEYLEWRREAEQALIKVLEKVEPNPDSTKEIWTRNPLAEANALVEEAIQDVKEENLSIIKNAVPNARIEKALQKCRKGLKLLEEKDGSFGNASLGDWDEALRKVYTAIKELETRQQLKYTMWAEKIFRACCQNTPVNEDKLKEDYLLLGRIDLSLVAEPSLAKEITQCMYEIYGQLESEAKTEVRYKSIMQLESRRKLDEF
jgi:hypothetical protein